MPSAWAPGARRSLADTKSSPSARPNAMPSGPVTPGIGLHASATGATLSNTPPSISTRAPSPAKPTRTTAPAVIAMRFQGFMAAPSSRQRQALAELEIGQPRIEAAAGDELGVAAFGHDLALFHHHDALE